MAEKVRLEDRECPLSSTLGLIGEWWTLLILHDAFDGYTRFDQFHENLGISSSLAVISFAAMSMTPSCKCNLHLHTCPRGRLLSRVR